MFAVLALVGKLFALVAGQLAAVTGLLALIIYGPTDRRH